MKRYILLPLMASLALGFASCNKDDDYFSDDAQNAPMQINKVYLEDHESTVPDREVEFGRLGQMLRLEGSGLYGVKKIYVNGYDTYFNRAYVTDANILVSLQGKTPISDCPEDVRNTIRLVKAGGNEYVYHFVIRAATPTVSSISNTLPIPGEKVIVYGTGLQETDDITLPGGTVLSRAAGADIESDDEDGEWFSFIMPAGLTASGSITAVNANGSIKTPAYFNERGGLFLDFDNTGSIASWSATYTPADDLEDDPLGTGRGKCAPFMPASALAEGPLQTGAKSLYWGTGGSGTNLDDWGAFTSLIPADTPVEEIAFQFDIYCPSPLTTGVLQFTLQNNLSNYGWNVAETKSDITEWCKCPSSFAWIPWYDGTEVVPFSTDGWTTVTVPLSKIGKYQDLTAGYTFQTVIDDRLAASYSNFLMLFVNSDIKYNDSTTLEATNYDGTFYVDNWRLVPFKQYVISDFPDEDEEETEE